MGHGFWWHLFNDPMDRNPWAAGAAVLTIVIITVVFLKFPRRWR